MKDGYTVADFQDYIPFTVKKTGDYEMEYIGGQNKSLIITCRQSFLYSHSLTHIIDRFAPIPLLARIDPLVLEAASTSLKENKYLNISLQFYSKVSKSLFANASPSSQSILSLNSDFCFCFYSLFIFSSFFCLFVYLSESSFFSIFIETTFFSCILC